MSGSRQWCQLASAAKVLFGVVQLWSLYRGVFFFSSRRRHTRCSRDWSSDVCSSDLERSTALIPRRPWRPVRARSLSAVLGLTLFLAGLLGSTHSRESPATVCPRAHFSFLCQRRAARAPAFAPSFTCQSVANHLLSRSRSADFRDAVSAFAVGGDREPAIPGRRLHFTGHTLSFPFRAKASSVSHLLESRAGEVKTRRGRQDTATWRPALPGRSCHHV